MQPEFNQPQLQSKIGILVMFFHTLQQYGRALAPALVIWVIQFDQVNKLYLAIGIIVTVIIVALIAYFQYKNFTFHIDNENEEFVIHEGVFNKSKTVIQLDRIQQVNITQSLIQRLVGVYALDVDTAGSTKKEGKIKAVSHQLALALKARLLDTERKIAVSEAEDAPQIATPADIPFISISFLSLLKVGITSNYIRSIGLIAAFFATIYENVNSYNRYSEYDDSRFRVDFDWQFALNSVLMIVVLILAAILVLNVVRTIVKFFNFKINRQSGSLLLSYGLLNTKSTIVKPEKVQITSVSRNYFQKKMDIVELKIKQATSGEKEERKSAIEIPGCNAMERDAILKLLFNVLPEKGAMMKPNFRKLVFSIFLLIVIPLSGYFLLAQYVPVVLNYVYLAPVYAIFVLLILVFSFRNYRIFINDDFIIKQSGAWDVTNEIVQIKKIQAVSTSQLLWHKGLDIGSLTIHTAGGDVAFQLGNYSKIKNYVNLWLYELETSDSNWM